MIDCVIIEDEPLARRLLEDYIQRVSDLHLIESFSDAMKGLQYLQENEISLLFLDIQMPDLNGLSLLKLLKNKPYVILTTAFSEYALEGYDLDVVDYLLKPIGLDRFYQAVDKVKSRLALVENFNKKDANYKENEILYVKDGTKLVRLALDDVMYIEGLKDYVSIITPHQKIVSLQRMKNLENVLPKGQFIRIHHSYIISVKWIQSIHKDFVEINHNSIPIGEMYRKAFREFVDAQKLLGTE